MLMESDFTPLHESYHMLSHKRHCTIAGVVHLSHVAVLFVVMQLFFHTLQKKCKYCWKSFIEITVIEYFVDNERW